MHEGRIAKPTDLTKDTIFKVAIGNLDNPVNCGNPEKCDDEVGH